jgi:hypothetical protein
VARTRRGFWGLDGCATGSVSRALKVNHCSHRGLAGRPTRLKFRSPLFNLIRSSLHLSIPSRRKFSSRYYPASLWRILYQQSLFLGVSRDSSSQCSTRRCGIMCIMGIYDGFSQCLQFRAKWSEHTKQQRPGHLSRMRMCPPSTRGTSHSCSSSCAVAKIIP